jgi:glycine dehydrogenase subunit 2
MELIFEKSVAGRHGTLLPKSDVPRAIELPEALRRAGSAGLPELSELEVVRHFSNLARRNFAVDTNFYPLGSCTMKYNAKATEEAVRPFAAVHPLLPYLPSGAAFVQGSLGVIHQLSRLLAEITGMAEFSCQPLAGAQGEMAGIMMIAAWHRARGDRRRFVVVPDSSHGTNPATAALVGYQVLTVPTAPTGDMDLDAFRQTMNNEVAAVMMTCPNTLGLFNPQVAEICAIAHEHGALVYCDGANLNAILGKVRPGEIGFDVMHVNLHKTFGTPHGGGGPGSGPVGVVEKLRPFLPSPQVVQGADGSFSLAAPGAESIGRLANFYGNFGILVRALAYITMLGKEGLLEVSEQAVLSANYVMSRLKGSYDLPFDTTCMHECVFSASRQLKHGVHALDIAKYLIDRGFHPPTVYFPLIVKEAIMIEPTETESQETLDEFCDAMLAIAREAQTDPELLKNAPVRTRTRRLDETAAARQPRLRWEG